MTEPHRTHRVDRSRAKNPERGTSNDRKATVVERRAMGLRMAVSSGP
jgi:hypothetical protein